MPLLDYIASIIERVLTNVLIAAVDRYFEQLSRPHVLAQADAAPDDEVARVHAQDDRLPPVDAPFVDKP